MQEWPVYDTTTNEIVFDGQRIPIFKRANSGRHVDVCAMLLRDQETMRGGLDYVDVLELWGIERGAKTRKGVYDIARWIEKTVFRATGKQGFVVYTMFDIRVNPIYLPKT